MLNLPMSKTRIWSIVFSLASTAVIALAVATGMAALAHAHPIYAQQTGLRCGQCHINPEGGGPRTAFGKAFAANGHHIPGDRRHSRFGARRGHERAGDGDHDWRMMGGYGGGMMGNGGMMGGDMMGR